MNLNLKQLKLNIIQSKNAKKLCEEHLPITELFVHGFFSQIE